MIDYNKIFEEATTEEDIKTLLTKQRRTNYKRIEDDEQKVIIEYCDLRNIPIVHIANEGKRSIQYATKLKAMGLRKGFPDMFIPIANKSFHGLFIELKANDGRPSKEQIKWINLLNRNGYKALVCYSADEAIKEINEYIQ